jgi:squalene cyclase
MTPNWTELSRISRHAGDLYRSGQLTEQTWRMLWAQAVVAVNGHTEFLESLVIFARPEWLKRP